MKRSLLIYIYFALFGQLAFGQVQMFADTVDNGCTTSVDVPIRVSDYVNMLSMQGTVHWDVAYLNYNSIVDYGPVSIGLTSGNFGFGSVGAGNLMFSWNDGDLSGETLVDSTIMFILRFDVVGAGSFSTPISFTSTPTLLEFVNLSYTPIPYTVYNGAVNIACSTCSLGTATTGMQTGCDPANDFYTQQLTVTYSAPPATGSLSVNGQLFPITSSPQTIVLDSLVSDGNPVDVNIFFTDDIACLLNMTSLFTAPASCLTLDVDIFADIINDVCVSTVDVPIRVSDFVDMLSMQGTVHWDVAYLNYNSIVDYGPAALLLTNGNFGVGSVAAGDLMFSWNDGDLSGETLADSTIVFTIRYDVIGAGSFSTPISFTSTPTLLEFVNLSYTPIPYSTQAGAVNITCSACSVGTATTGTQTSCNPTNDFYTQELVITYSTPPATGSLSVNGQLFPITGSPQTVVLDSLVSDGSPVNIDIFFTDDIACLLSMPALFTAPPACLAFDVDIFADTVSGVCVSTVDVPIRVSDFVNMLSMQGTVHWDVAYLNYNSIVDYGPAALALTNGNFGFGSVAAGDLMFSWNDGDLSGETLADSTIVFTIRYDIIGTGSFITPISFTSTPTLLEFVNTGFVPIPYTTQAGAVNITCSTCSIATATAGSQTSCNPTNDFYTQELVITYSVPPATGSLSVNGQLFPITGSPQTVVLDSLLSDGNPVDANIFFTDDIACLLNLTSLFIAPAPCLAQDVDIYADLVTDSCVSTIDVPVRVSDFIDMLSMQGTVHWDVAYLNYNSIVDYGPASLALTIGNFGTGSVAAGDLMFSWNDGDLSGETLADSTIIFTIRYDIVAAGIFSTPITFTNTPTPLEFVNTGYVPIPYTTQDGAVNINCPQANAIDLFFTEYGCTSDSIYTIDVTASNFANIVSYQGTVGWDTTLFAFDSISFYGPANVLLTAGNFGLPLVSQGVLTFSWYDGDLSGEYLNDSTILFSFVLNTTADFGCTNITFESAPTPVEFIDSLTQEVPTILHNMQLCKSFTYFDSLDICAGDSVMIGGIYQSTSGIYIDSLITLTGCDSLISYDLTVLPYNTFTDVQIICDSLLWIDGITYYANNNLATWVLTSAAGCDSTVTLDLTIYTATFTTDTQSACDSITWMDGITYTVNNATATWVLTNVAGCDSTITLDLTILNSTTSTDVQTACDSLVWVDGLTYYTSNNAATWVLVNAVGCDSTITLDLTMSFTSSTTDTQIACDSLLWIDGITYYANNTSATWLLTNAAGCDSTVTLDLTVNIATTGVDTQIACDSLIWMDGITYYANNNTATWALTNAVGCDSTVTLDLSVLTATTSTDIQTACDSITWIDGITYYANNNTASHVLTNIAGCDSTILLDLTIINATTSTDIQTACDTYTWMDGNAYAASNNTATWVIPNAVGCDSTITLDLTINNSTTSTDVQVACDSLTWMDGVTYYANNNTATWLLTNAVGCDSLITLDLTVNNANTGIDTQIACDSLTWMDGITYYAANNTATWVLTNAAGCDSTVTLDLTITIATISTEVQVACDSIVWQDGNTYYANNNTATWVLTNVAGCDSTITLDLTILNSTTSTDVQTACDTYTWMDGNTYAASNTAAIWVIPNAIGCDSTITLDLTMSFSNSVTDVQVACDSMTWMDGNTYYADNNTASWLLTNAAGCDSLITLNLIVNTANTGVDTQFSCDSLIWMDGITYYANNNTATWTLTNAAGCDSTVTLDLTIVTAFFTTDTQSVCDSLTWIDGITYYANNNTATQLLTSISGCDSTVTLNLTIVYSTTSTDVQTACDTYTWIDGNTYLTSNNTATWVIPNAVGCDSTITLDLTMSFTSAVTDVQMACDSLMWVDGITYYTNNNTATWLLTNAAGCDSTVTLDLTVNNATTGIDIQIACDSIIWIDGITYYADNNTAIWTLTNAVGCDSTVTLDLTIVAATTSTDVQVTCDSLTWIDGITYYVNNTAATHVLTNAVGCDSTITLDLTISNSTTSTDVQIACDTYTWIDGNTYAASNNIATWVIPNAVGCDSTITLDLTLSNSTSSTDVQVACDSTIWMDGITYYTDNNTATWLLTNAAGCDSTITLDLTVNNATTGVDTQTACDSIVWIDGVTYYVDNNTATWIILNAAGCDSTITLDLTISGVSTSSIDVQSACDSYTWIDGNNYISNNSSATWTIPNSAGCDSIINLDLTINTSSSSTDVQTACKTYTWIDGNTYTTNNNTATWTLTNAAGCDSIITLDLTVTSVDASVTDNSPTLTANASGAVYQWINCDTGNSPMAGETNQVFTATVNGNYAVIVTQNGCTDTSVCVLVDNIGLDEESLNKLIVIYPNPTTNGHFKIQYEGEITSIQMTDVIGKVHAIYFNSTTGEVDASLLASGRYFVRIVTELGTITKDIIISSEE
ncbi:MAG: T9SS type A sorting domain-containing protein [Crocinitomicaceae bacterium]|nr:T9SS type A sorting domain-containing protein [Crocinitomicaceae bacterium]